jgi:hypothetical protein
MRIRTIFAAAAAPLAIGGVLLTTTAASASTGNGNGPGQSISAYYWNANGHALSGPQCDPADFSNPAGLALVAENAHGQNIASRTITIKGHMDPSLATALHSAYQNDVGAYARIWFDGAGGSSAQSPQGYLGQVWWNHAALDLNSSTASDPTGFTVTAQVMPTGDWGDWNGKTADQNVDLFNGAASHVQQIGLSFGGASWFEDGVTGIGAITIDSIQVGP